MRSKLLLFIVSGCLYFAMIPSSYGQAIGTDAPRPISIEVYFSPKGGALDAILKEINAAKTSILVQAYSFNSTPIAEALAAAQKRNVMVSVLLDKTKTMEEKTTAVDILTRSGIPTSLDGNHNTAHNKLMIFDGQVVITGSFNYTKHSEQDNAENLLVIRDKTLADKYTANWNSHAKHSTPYKREIK
jgi:phosphatidylserine/phosphatidylglycerophosphate/cardiolipin synthase-like enzyme